MKALIATLGAAACVTMPVAAAAQTGDSQTGTRLTYKSGKDSKSLGDRAVVQAVQRWAECVYQKRDRTVIRMLTTVDVDDLENAAELVYKDVACDIYVKGSNADNFALNTSFATDRGLFAEAALKSKGDLRSSATVPEALPMSEGYNRAWFAMTSRSNTVDAMAICFAETQPSLTLELLRSDRKSPEENAAIGNIAAVLGDCLSAGASLNANAFELRNALAEAYFQRLYGTNDPMALTQPEEETAAAGAEG